MIPAERPTHQRYVLMALLFAHTLHTYIDRVCISVAAADIKAELSLSDQTMGNVFAVFALGYALFQIPAGRMADRIGPRRALAWVVGAWSLFTGLTGLAFNGVYLIWIRFLFGVGESGAFPGATRALYAWLPARERGIAQGIFHSGARVGAALALLVLPWVVAAIGWRWMFVLAGLSGLAWLAVWCAWFRDDPASHPRMNAAELSLIEAGRTVENTDGASKELWRVLTSTNLLLAMFQYAASNATFFISFTWLLPYLQTRWGPTAATLAPVPLVCGTLAQWFSGWLVSTLHQRGAEMASRRGPAIAGFIVSAIGLTLCVAIPSDSALVFVLCFSIAVFGVEMTISPSWAFCMDIGGAHSGTVSGAMNMVGNFGAALSAMAFPWFIAHGARMGFVSRTNSADAFFVFAAVLNLIGAAVWLGMNSRRHAGDGSRWRVVAFVALMATAVVAISMKFLVR